MHRGAQRGCLLGICRHSCCERDLYYPSHRYGDDHIPNFGGSRTDAISFRSVALCGGTDRIRHSAHFGSQTRFKGSTASVEICPSASTVLDFFVFCMWWREQLKQSTTKPKWHSCRNLHSDGDADNRLEQTSSPGRAVEERCDGECALDWSPLAGLVGSSRCQRRRCRYRFHRT